MHALLLSSALFVAAAWAQTPIPACSVECFTATLQASGCASSTDYSCLCRREDLSGQLIECLQKSCSATDFTAALSIVETYCANYIETASPSSPAASSTTSSHSSSLSAPLSTHPASAHSSTLSASLSIHPHSSPDTTTTTTSCACDTTSATTATTMPAAPSVPGGYASATTDVAGAQPTGGLDEDLDEFPPPPPSATSPTAPIYGSLSDYLPVAPIATGTSSTSLPYFYDYYGTGLSGTTTPSLSTGTAGPSAPTPTTAPSADAGYYYPFNTTSTSVLQYNGTGAATHATGAPVGGLLALLLAALYAL